MMPWYTKNTVLATVPAVLCGNSHKPETPGTSSAHLPSTKITLPYGHQGKVLCL